MTSEVLLVINKLGQENITYRVHPAHAFLKTFNSGNATLQNVLLCWLLNCLNLLTGPRLRSGIRGDPWPANLFLEFSNSSRVSVCAGITFTGDFCFSTDLQYGKKLLRAYSIPHPLGVPFPTACLSSKKIKMLDPPSPQKKKQICIWYTTCYLHHDGKCTVTKAI